MANILPTVEPGSRGEDLTTVPEDLHRLTGRLL
jgi:hypothetical protein